MAVFKIDSELCSLHLDYHTDSYTRPDHEHGYSRHQIIYYRRLVRFHIHGANYELDED